jgi:DNA-binding HxlR family transcriptional regulator
MAQATNSDHRSAARAIGLVGERWTLLLLREAFAGTWRWADFHDRLDINSSVLAIRLRQLIAAGLFERVPYQSRPPRCEYRLTAAGRELWPVAVALMSWGERHGAPSGLDFEHAGCGGTATHTSSCEKCGAELRLEDVVPLRLEARAANTHGEEIRGRS